jgi:glycerol-3-phosphate dehydrogenase
MIENHVGKNKFALLSGPIFAREILKDRMSFAILASKDKTVFDVHYLMTTFP